MATAFAMAAVTHILRRVLMDAGTSEATAALAGDAGWQVSTLAPDLVQRGPGDPPLLNLFLYHVAENTDGRNRRPGPIDPGGPRMDDAPLVLDLHYLVTAYGSVACQAELLLAHAMLALHRRPVLDRDTIVGAFDPDVPAEASMAACGLDRQTEALRLIPDALSMQALHGIWKGLRLALRPSASYRVTVAMRSDRTAGMPAHPVVVKPSITVPNAHVGIGINTRRAGQT